ncbi:nucleotidyltransferase domain-containing protein [Streptomyces silaceus]|uniref:nucleotidyltransferase domain-containing protein n=1 Tax=Streptomyces silaceus TaxID=545123 RepID=UPI00099EF2D0|nr:aminoglycoside adenylyltransferase [Streptomyces silaceus]
MDRERADRQLRLITEVMDVAEAHGISVWLRGGWAMDFFLGEITRDHEDIDWFLWDSGAGALTDALPARGYEATGASPPEQQLDYVKDGLESSFTLLSRDAAGQAEVAGGPWAGTAWPEAMPGTTPGRLAGLTCPIVGPRGQIDIKRLTPQWVPGMPRRAKDAEDIARLEAALAAQDERGADERRSGVNHRGPGAE